jgi:hypothetical protein
MIGRERKKIIGGIYVYSHNYKLCIKKYNILGDVYMTLCVTDITT